jgi:hypothetical protein
MLLVLATALPDGAAACSICLAGDPVFTSQGTTGHEVGKISTYVEYRNIRKRSGPLPGEPADHEERNNSQRLDFFVSVTPLDRVTLSINIPYVWNEVTELGDTGPEQFKLDGLGDISLASNVVIWRNRDVLPTTWVDGRFFVKLPTGNSSQSIDGTKDPHVQEGTGSVDFGFGLGGVHRSDHATFFGSATYRVNQEGTLDYRYGNAFLMTVGTEVPVGKYLGWGPSSLTPGVQLDLRHTERDEFEGVNYQHSGGTIVFVTPSIRVQLPWFEGRDAPFLRGAVQVPLGDRGLSGFQEEKPIWLVGIQKNFSIPSLGWFGHDG